MNKLRRGRKAKYPWDKWLARKKEFTLVRGVHFDAQVHGMAQAIRNAAGRREKRVHISIEEDTLLVKVLR